MYSVFNILHNNHSPNEAAFSSLAKELVDETMRIRISYGQSNALYYFWSVVKKYNMAKAVADTIDKNEDACVNGDFYHSLGQQSGLADSDPDRAIAYLEKARKFGYRSESTIETSIGNIHLNRANIAGKIGNTKLKLAQLRLAAGRYEKATRLTPQNWQNIAKLAEIYADLSKLDNSRETFKKAEKAIIKLFYDGSYRSNYFHQYFKSLGDKAKSKKLYDVASPLYEKAWRLLFYYDRQPYESYIQNYSSASAEALIMTGKLNEGVDRFLEGYVRLPRNSYNRVNLAGQLLKALKNAGKLEGFIASYEEEVKKTGLEKPHLRVTFGHHFANLKNDREALKHYRVAADFLLGDIGVLQNVRDLAKKLRDRKNTEWALKKLCAADPKNAQRYREFGRFLEETEGKAVAMKAYSMMVEALPTEAASHRLLGDIYWDRWLPKKAVREYRYVVKYRPEEPRGYWRLVEMLTKTGATGEARDILKNMLEMEWEQRFGNVKQNAKRRLENLKSK